MWIASAISAEETANNELSLSQSSSDLDVNLKKALLKALAELENEERTNKNDSNAKIIKNDRVFEKASASAVNFIASSPSPSSIASTTTPASISTSSQNPVIVQKSDGVQHQTVFSFEPVLGGDKEQIETSASSSFLQNQNDISETTKPTTTTTAAPPSSTEENEAKVEDVQFFSAPLVAAFTVHQDERGLPRSVVPIFKETENVRTNSSPVENKLQSDILLNYQEQQKALTEQISKLQKQQQFYNDYLQRQQGVVLQNVQPTPVIEHTIPVTQPQHFFTTNSIAQPQNTVLIQPSYTFTPPQQQISITSTTFPPPQPPTSFPTPGQQLPIKNAVDFNKNNYFLPLRYNTLVQQQQQHAPELNPFHVPTVQPSHTRIFRQELHTGNFLNTPTFTQHNQFPFYQQQQQQQFRGNYHNVATSPFFIQPPVVNQRLNDLLYRSGIGFGKQQEDLSIVSKVLALNRLRRNSYVINSRTPDVVAE